MSGKNLRDYWMKNLTYVGILLAVWFLVSYGAGILFADSLNSIRLFGFQLGFWFAQQGSMIGFVVLKMLVPCNESYKLNAWPGKKLKHRPKQKRKHVIV